MSSASTKQDLFKFDSSKWSILRHEYLNDASKRHHDIILVPGSTMMAMWMTAACRTKTQKFYPESTSPTSDSEDDVWTKIAYDSGYDVYSWTSSLPVFGFKIDKLGSATI